MPSWVISTALGTWLPVSTTYVQQDMTNNQAYTVSCVKLVYASFMQFYASFVYYPTSQAAAWTPPQTSRCGLASVLTRTVSSSS